MSTINKEFMVCSKNTDNGLSVHFIQRKGYNHQSFMLTANFGSIHNNFLEKDKGVYHPYGVAHFLEHKVFDQPNKKSIKPILLNQEATATAITTHEMTNFQVVCTNNIENNLILLLDHVQNAKFTTESIDHEKKIIKQEILMYQDNLQWISMQTFLKGLYGEGDPICIDVAGSVDSIELINQKHLQDCYQSFYHPLNMDLVITGDLDIETLFSIIKKNQERKTFALPVLSKIKHNEVRSQLVKKNVSVITLGIKTPLVKFGFRNGIIIDSLKNFCELSIGLEAIFGKFSEFHQESLLLGLIDEGFNWNLNYKSNYKYSIISGYSKKPSQLYDAILKVLSKISNEGIPERILEESKLRHINRYAYKFNSLKYVNEKFSEYHLMGVNFLDIFRVSNSVKNEEIIKTVRSHLKLDKLHFSVIE